MKTKLTLSIDAATVTRARQLSKKQRKSVSALFEAFIDQQDKMQFNKRSSSVVDELTGILHDPQLPYKTLKETYRKSKLKPGRHA